MVIAMCYVLFSFVLFKAYTVANSPISSLQRPTMAANYKILFLVLVVLLARGLSPFVLAADDGETLVASFIFGDSLVDAGNNNYLQTLSKANITPNGIDFKASGGQPTGRYTNGRTIGDIVGEYVNCLLHFIIK